MKRLALCIGNESYKTLPRLKCAVADAQAIAETLKSLGFDVILKTDLNRSELADAIFSTKDVLQNYDAILIYYAGHGFQVDNDNILAPIDLTINQRPEAVRYEAFPLQAVLEILSAYPEQTKVVILDACRENLGLRGSFQTFAPISAPQGSIIAFSTSPGKYSRESELSGHGKYTEALLKYISLPRVEIETVFKKVRETLAAETGGTQIPWEHTSLIGQFYLNPDTIYDGAVYVQEAISDIHFSFSIGSKIKVIVDGLKTQNWPAQETAINSVSGIDFHNASINELFVLGRNIYQAADGNSFACQHFIDGFEANKRIPDGAKTHILNGMAFEIYYDSMGELRNRMKTGYYVKIINMLENPAFFSSREFISSYLCKLEERPIYIPGQNEIMYFSVKLEEMSNRLYIREIIYQGHNILFIDTDNEENWYPTSFIRYEFEHRIATMLVAPQDMVRFQYNNPSFDTKTRASILDSNFSLLF